MSGKITARSSAPLMKTKDVLLKIIFDNYHKTICETIPHAYPLGKGSLRRVLS
jgi:hypothetical protein